MLVREHHLGGLGGNGYGARHFWTLTTCLVWEHMNELNRTGECQLSSTFPDYPTAPFRSFTY